MWLTTSQTYCESPALELEQTKPKLVAQEYRSRSLSEKAEQQTQVRTMAARTQFRMEMVNRQTLRPSITEKDLTCLGPLIMWILLFTATVVH